MELWKRSEGLKEITRRNRDRLLTPFAGSSRALGKGKLTVGRRLLEVVSNISQGRKGLAGQESINEKSIAN